jgi:PAS domain S-box-containing protein
MKRTEAQLKVARALVALGTVYVLLWCPHALALDPSLDVSQYAHKAWTYRDGFLPGAVYAITQTPDGYLWLGTPSGVVRFDGVRGVPLPLPPGQQLPSTGVAALLTAHDGTLWIGTLDGLVSWKNGQLTGYPVLAHHTVLALLQDRTGTVWAGGFVGSTGILCAIRGASTTCYGDDGSLGTVVASLYEDSDGSLWVGAATGLWRWRPGPPTRYLATPISHGGKMTQGDHGSGVIVAVDSVRQIIGRTVTDYRLLGVPAPLTAGTVLRDRNGGLWIGTSAHGLVHSYAGKTSMFTHNDGLSGDQVFALFEGREGAIWVATSDGLDQFRELPVTSLSVKQGLSSATASSVLAARDGSIWVGTTDGLTRWKDGRTTIYRRRSNPGLPDDDIYSLFEDERGRIWVSSFRGLAAFEKGKFTAVPSVPAGTKNAIAGDNRGGLWLSLFGTANDYGLVHLVGGKIIEQVPWQKLGGGPGTGLVPDPDGGVWTGLLSGGIAYFRAGQIRNLPLSDDRAGTRKVLDISRNRDGSIWAATANGLSRIKNGRVPTLTTANGLPCNTVHWIIEDDLSSYWLYTQCGLLRVARTDMDAWIADPKRTIQPMTFDAEDGIRLVPILKGSRPEVTKSSDGKIWFVNGDTLSFIDPARIAINPLPPPVHIEKITADGKAYDASNGLRLPAGGVRDLLFDFTALSLEVPEKVRFRVKLEGQDNGWRELVNQRHVEYTNLAPRTYRFRVLACNNSGVWNEQGDVLDFSIAPAYYQTNWFRALCAAAFLALLWAAYRMRVRQLQQQEEKLRETIENIPAIAFIVGPDGSRTFVNKRWVEYTGLDVALASGAGWEAAVHPDDLKRVVDTWRRSTTTGQPVEYEVRFRRAADGEYRWHLVRAVPLRDKRGRIVKWYGVMADIEDRKRAEQLQADLAHINRVSLMGELTASLSHELKQPIAAAVISANAALRWLKRDQPDVERACAAAMRIVEDGKRAGDIIERLRSFYKKAPPRRELVDVNDIVPQMTALLRGEANRYGVSVRTDLTADVPKVTADRVQLQQVLMNLMLNGIEAMKETGGVLTVKSQLAEHGRVMISVSDTGVGLPADKADQIFNAFFTTKPQGSGMGLAISRSIVDSHGGRLWATANDGRGATFHFTLPTATEVLQVPATGM